MIYLSLIGILLVILNIIMKGWVICMLWIMFITPTFGIKSINIYQAIGIGLLISYITFKLNIENYNYENIKLDKVQKGMIKQIFNIVISIFTFILGYTIYKFAHFLNFP